MVYIKFYQNSTRSGSPGYIIGKKLLTAYTITNSTGNFFASNKDGFFFYGKHNNDGLCIENFGSGNDYISERIPLRFGKNIGYGCKLNLDPDWENLRV